MSPFKEDAHHPGKNKPFRQSTPKKKKIVELADLGGRKHSLRTKKEGESTRVLLGRKKKKAYFAFIKLGVLLGKGLGWAT